MRITSLCEKDFITNCISKNRRLDGRSLNDGRTIEIIFGQEWGCDMVSMGNTKVLAQVSAEVTEPKTSTPNEGTLHINLELSSMSAPEVQYQSRISDEFVEFQRILERCIRDSKCVDLESLCIVAGSKVWTIRVDIHTLNDDGNLIECSCIAAISALAHFKRPEVTVMGTEVTVHSLDDRDPVRLNLYHMPIAINLALYEQGEYIVVDPLEKEERIADGCYIIGMNAHQEICLVHRKGVLLLSCDTIKRCEDTATRRSQDVTQIIRQALDDDSYKRATKAPVGFVNMIQTGTILGTKVPVKKVDLHEIVKNAETLVVKDDNSVMDITEGQVSTKKKHLTSPPKQSQTGIKVAQFLKEAEQQHSIFEGGSSKWTNLSSEESTDEDMLTNETASKSDSKKKANASESHSKRKASASKNESKKKAGSSKRQPKQEGSTSQSNAKKKASSSSEDETVMVTTDHLDVKPSGARGWYSADPFA